jgi:hypothetical protein
MWLNDLFSPVSSSLFSFINCFHMSTKYVSMGYLLVLYPIVYGLVVFIPLTEYHFIWLLLMYVDFIVICSLVRVVFILILHGEVW